MSTLLGSVPRSVALATVVAGGDPEPEEPAEARLHAVSPSSNTHPSKTAITRRDGCPEERLEAGELSLRAGFGIHKFIASLSWNELAFRGCWDRSNFLGL